MDRLRYIYGYVRQVTFIDSNIHHNSRNLLDLDVAQERETEGGLVLGDIGYGMPFRAGSFDGAIRYETQF
jgi:hypothetical protein